MRYIVVHLFQEAYVRGLMSYNSDDWEGVKTNMEVAITEFYHEEERCRVECEAIYESAVPQEFVSAVAGTYPYFSRCFVCSTISTIKSTPSVI